MLQQAIEVAFNHAAADEGTISSNSDETRESEDPGCFQDGPFGKWAERNHRPEDNDRSNERGPGRIHQHTRTPARVPGRIHQPPRQPGHGKLSLAHLTRKY